MDLDTSSGHNIPSRRISHQDQYVIMWYDDHLLDKQDGPATAV